MGNSDRLTSNIRFINRGEQILYKDDSHLVECEFTYIDRKRFFTDSVLQCRKMNRNLSQSEREVIVERVIRWLLESVELLKVVIDEVDPCRKSLEDIAISFNASIEIEYDNEAKQSQNYQRMLDQIHDTKV